jgi:hypothetical protein
MMCARASAPDRWPSGLNSTREQRVKPLRSSSFSTPPFVVQRARAGPIPKTRD